MDTPFALQNSGPVCHFIHMIGKVWKDFFCEFMTTLFSVNVCRKTILHEKESLS